MSDDAYKFRFYKPLPVELGDGFMITDGTKYFYDEYGGWVDNGIWYDEDGIPMGKVDPFNAFTPDWQLGRATYEFFKVGEEHVKYIKDSLNEIDDQKDAIDIRLLVSGGEDNLEAQELEDFLTNYAYIKGIAKVKPFKNQPELLSISVNSKEAAKQVLLQSGKFLKKIVNNQYQRKKILIRLYKKIRQEQVYNPDEEYFIQFMGLKGDALLLQDTLIQQLRLRDKDISAVTTIRVDPSRGAIRTCSKKIMEKILKAQITINGCKLTFK